MTSTPLPDALRARGLRMTAPRQLVLEAVRRLGHATPEQLHDEVTRTAEGINLTTVYRTLDLLEDLRLVTHTHLTHGPPTYHSADDDRHVHLVCRECQGVTEVEPALFDEVAARVLTEYGFGADVEHLALFGLCRSCAGTPPDPTP